MKRHYLSAQKIGKWLQFFFKYALKRVIVMAPLGLGFTANAQTTTIFFKEFITTSPLKDATEGRKSYPILVDLDDDGDFDLVAGRYDGKFSYYQNNGDKNSPVFDLHTAQNSPVFGINITSNSFGDFADFDNDGDLDFVAGGATTGSLRYYKNIGTKTKAVFELQTALDGPFASFPTNQYVGMSFEDVDGDGDYDILFGRKGGEIWYYQNIGSKTAPKFFTPGASQNPFNGIKVDANAQPRLVDLDKDGDLDLVVGKYLNAPAYYENTGTVTAPIFKEATNPFTKLRYNSAGAVVPEFADIDADGDFDMLFGAYYGEFQYFENQSNILNTIEKTENSVSAYPNPVQNSLQIDFSATENTEIVLTDMFGKEWIKTQETTIDVSNLPQGIYVLSIKEEGILLSNQKIQINQ